jgi:hypothetical protein
VLPLSRDEQEDRHEYSEDDFAQPFAAHSSTPRLKSSHDQEADCHRFRRFVS